MDGVNRPGAGQQVPAADENEDKENTPPENQHKPQTGFGERPKGMTLKERMAANKGGITPADSGPSVRPTNTSSGEDGSDAGASENS